ncbi:MAG: NAD(P)/FAD-dependent oxidoreductase [Ilumatobacteraceae bacterium]
MASSREWRPGATVLALGGASWPGTGSDGGWTDVLAQAGWRSAAAAGQLRLRDGLGRRVPRPLRAGEPLKNLPGLVRWRGAPEG